MSFSGYPLFNRPVHPGISLIKTPLVFRNEYTERMSHRPVVLVHGWNSHPGVWNRLVPRLEEQGFPVWNFAHDKCVNLAPDEIAYLLQDYIRDRRAATDYRGEIDLVCHSMGGSIARYLIEVIDGRERTEHVRQLIGLGPPNNGSALAEIFFDPEMGPGVIKRLTGSFVPPGFKPDEDRIVREFRFGSRTISRLQQAGTRDDIAYRMILSGNRQLRPEFFPPFEGRTWEYDPEEGWRKTCDGDGIVPHRDSWLPGAERRDPAGRSHAFAVAPGSLLPHLLATERGGHCPGGKVPQPCRRPQHRGVESGSGTPAGYPGVSSPCLPTPFLNLSTFSIYAKDPAGRRSFPTGRGVWYSWRFGLPDSVIPGDS